MPSRTLFLSRLIGLFTLIVVLSMLVDKARAMNMISALVHALSAVIVVGMLGVAAGLAIVLDHQLWSGGVLPVVVTLLGWVILIRGTILLFLPPAVIARFIECRLGRGSAMERLPKHVMSSNRR
jgi:hypothetical protein